MGGYVNTDLDSINDFKVALANFLNDTESYVDQTERILNQIETNLMYCDNNDMNDNEKDTLNLCISGICKAEEYFQETLKQNSVADLRESVINVLNQLLKVLEEYKRI